MTALDTNQTLAKEYIKLQSKHMDRKNLFISSYEKSRIAQDKLNDKENVSSFLLPRVSKRNSFFTGILFY